MHRSKGSKESRCSKRGDTGWKAPQFRGLPHVIKIGTLDAQKNLTGREIHFWKKSRREEKGTAGSVWHRVEGKVANKINTDRAANMWVKTLVKETRRGKSLNSQCC